MLAWGQTNSNSRRDTRQNSGNVEHPSQIWLEEQPETRYIMQLQAMQVRLQHSEKQLQIASSQIFLILDQEKN